MGHAGFMGDLFAALDTAPVCGQVEQWALKQGYRLIIGMDEAGRGPLAGPVVAAAVALPHPCPIEGINDSKKLSEARREALFDVISERALGFSVCVVEREEIDDLNILHASMTGMARAYHCLLYTSPSPRDVEESRMPSSA